MRTPAHLIDTAFGRAVLIKICLLLVLIALGAFNRRRSVPELSRLAAEGATPGRAGLELRRALRAEVGLIVVVLGVTAALSAYAPSTQAYDRPGEPQRHGGARAARDDGRPRARRRQPDPPLSAQPEGRHASSRAPRRSTCRAVMPSKGIGPLQQAARPGRAGSLHRSSALLGVPGKWRADRHRANLGVRRVHQDLHGARAVRRRCGTALIVGVAIAALLDSPTLGRGVLFLLPCLLLLLALLCGALPGRAAARPGGCAGAGAGRTRVAGAQPAPRGSGACVGGSWRSRAPPAPRRAAPSPRRPSPT